MNKIAAILWCILSLAWTTASWAQNVAVSGKVTGANGEAIIGANVLVEGTTQGITTNVDGDYTLTNVPANATLVVSYLGYKTEKIPVGNKTRIDVTLREDTAEIEGVMVVAYGTAKKESFTGSAAVVKGGELQKRVVGNVTKSFEGTVAGVQVASGGGQPGEAASVIIRGIGSVNASATPLYVVDGIPFDGSLSAINPADIETMTVLKDASAGALYGARGANGVIVITTKKGKKDKIRISYKGNVGIASRAIPRYDLVDMKDYVEMSYEALRNSAQYGTGMDFEGASRYAAANLGGGYYVILGKLVRKGGQAFGLGGKGLHLVNLPPAKGFGKGSFTAVQRAGNKQHVTKTPSTGKTQGPPAYTVPLFAKTTRPNLR